MGHFAKIGPLIWTHYGFKILTIFTKYSVLDVDRFLNSPILTTLRSTTIHVKHEHNTAQKRSFPLKISLIYVIKSAVSCGIGHIYGRNS